MSQKLTLDAELRDDLGKSASRRHRRLDKLVPAIIYGGKKAPQPLTVIEKDFEKALQNEAFFSQVIEIKVDGDSEKAVLKDLQRHPAKNLIMHADFLRIDDKVQIKMNVPIHFINEEKCYGVKMDGGLVQHQATDIEVQCLPGDIPEYVSVDMENVKIGEIVHLSDISLPEGVVSVALALGEDYDLAVASVIAPKGAAIDEEDDGEVDEASDSTAEEGTEEEEKTE